MKAKELNDLAELLTEAASIMRGDKVMRLPIADELDGFSSALRSATPTQHPAHSGSVDSPEFRNLVADIYSAGICNGSLEVPTAALIAHIDTWAARRAVPEGWQVVPKIPSLEMQQMALKASRECVLEDSQPSPLPTGYELWSSMYIYRVMLAAAPAPNSQPKEDAK